MRPPIQTVGLVVLAGTLLFGVATVGTVGSAISEADTAIQSSSEPVIVENGSTYDVSQTLQFDVSQPNDMYEVRTEDLAYVDAITAQDGVATLDTSGMNPGAYVLVHHENQTVEYEFTLEGSESSPTSTSTTADPATTVEDGGHYEIPAQLLFENLRENDDYELRKGEENLYVDQFQATNGNVRIDTEGLSPGEFALIHVESGRIPYQFTLDGRETTAEPTTTVTTASTTETTDRNAPLNRSTTSVKVTASVTEESTTRTPSPTTEDESTKSTKSSTTQSQTTETRRNDGYYPSVPGFGFESGILALVAGGVLLFRRYR